MSFWVVNLCFVILSPVHKTSEKFTALFGVVRISIRETPENESGNNYLVLPVKNHILRHFTDVNSSNLLIHGKDSHLKIQEKILCFYL